MRIDKSGWSLMDSDSELVLAARAGDRAAFGELITRYEPMVRRLAWRMIGDDDLARDLAQEALLQAYLSLEDLRQDRSFRSWVYGITLNVCRMYVRSQRSNIYSLDVLVGGLYADEPTPEEIVERLELRRAVMNAVEALSPANRAAVLLCYYEDFSLRDGAAMLGISVTAFKGRLHKARRQLQASLLSATVTLERGVTRMIPVKIVDVMDSASVRDEGRPPFNQVILLDEVSRRALIIWVGTAEGQAIAFGLGDYSFGRPIMPVFMSRLLQAAGATLDQVVISTLKDDVFYATVRVRTGDSTQDVDARPSDALALAVQMKMPIYVSEDVLDRIGVPLPAGATPTGQGIKNLIGAVDAQVKRLRMDVDEETQRQRAEQLKREYDKKNEVVLHEAFSTKTQ